MSVISFLRLPLRSGDRTRGGNLAKIVALAGAAVILAACVSPDARRNVTDIPNAQLPPPTGSRASARPLHGSQFVRDGIRYVEVLDGESIENVADRVGVDSGSLASHNRMQVNTTPAPGTVISLPAEQERAAPPLPGTSQENQFAARDGNAIAGRPAQHEMQTQSTRHRVQKGETAYDIAQLYGISVRILADWNQLDARFSVSEGDILVIPMVNSTPQEILPNEAVVEAPKDDAVDTQASVDTASQVQPEKSSADLEQVSVRSSGYVFPMAGEVTREYSVGGEDQHEGLRISASEGTTIHSIADGKVALIDDLNENNLIIIIRHSSNMYSIYQNVVSRAVRDKQDVVRGQEIGKLGETPGYLYFEIRLGIDSVNPRNYLPAVSS